MLNVFARTFMTATLSDTDPREVPAPDPRPRRQGEGWLPGRVAGWFTAR